MARNRFAAPNRIHALVRLRLQMNLFGGNTQRLPQRLAHLLLHLMELYGVADPDGTVIAAAFTHADLAHMVGATRQWVTISLKRMQEKQIVLAKRSQIVVCRPDVLDEMRGHSSE